MGILSIAVYSISCAVVQLANSYQTLNACAVFRTTPPERLANGKVQVYIMISQPLSRVQVVPSNIMARLENIMKIWLIRLDGCMME